MELASCDVEYDLDFIGGCVGRVADLRDQWGVF